MAKTNATESPLEAAAGAAGPRAAEAFSILGNETRLAILLALWEAYEPFTKENAPRCGQSEAAIEAATGVSQATIATILERRGKYLAGAARVGGG